MYTFPEELRKAYEDSPLSFVYYQNIDGKGVPILASAGFCKAVGLSRDIVLDWLQIALFERMNPDDVGIVSRVSDDFLNKRGPYDVVFRCYIDPTEGNPGAGSEQTTGADMLVHGIGAWQTMPDGIELMVITYSNVLKTQEAARRNVDIYRKYQKDRFYTDPLTALPNLNYLREFGGEKIATLLREGRKPYVVYTDINAMQSYNNQYGIKAGDQFLKLIADSLKEKFPKALLIRGSDDHFIMITGADDNASIEKDLREVNSYVCRNAYGNTTGFDSGVCPIEAGSEYIEALDHAKHALKQIENDLNREVAFFSKEADEAYWRSRYIVENFDLAMEQNWIRVFYHPLIRLESEKIAALEGLARWLDPNRGIISPGEFIPALSKYHLLYKLDLYIFEEVCKEVTIRYENGLPLTPISVNFSRQDFDHADIVGEMNRLFDKYALSDYFDKSYFIVEITEQDMAVGEEKFEEQLRLLRENGYRIWLDDFGSGYSSISMFSHYDFDLVKFDMDLLRHLDDKGGINRIILKDLMIMVRELKLHTLIEGVETEEHLKFAREIGCELGQGFYFNKPTSLDEILFLMQHGDDVKPCETAREREELNKRL